MLDHEQVEVLRDIRQVVNRIDNVLLTMALEGVHGAAKHTLDVQLASLKTLREKLK